MLSFARIQACPSSKCRPRQKQGNSLAQTFEYEMRIEPGAFANPAMFSVSNLWTGLSRIHKGRVAQPLNFRVAHAYGFKRGDFGFF